MLRAALPLALAILVALGAAVAEPEATEKIDLDRFDKLIKPTDREHWAFQPVQRPDVPTVKGTTWVRNPIDAFVLAKLEAKGWQPNAPAERAALLRRVYLDVIGLPPTPAEQDALLKEETPGAWERLIEQLLASPHYGERWGRHWLDQARYAETNGYERDATKPSVWKYRDYVISALNTDKPFDRFILEQLAGDELDDMSAETLIATGFQRLGPWDDEPADPLEDRFDQLDDMVSTTAQVFLGLTLGCARCHNHKFEPLTQHDYYRMVAVFGPLQRPQNGRMELDSPAGSPAEVKAQTERDQQIAALTRETTSQHAALFASAPSSPLSMLFNLNRSLDQTARLQWDIAQLKLTTPDLPRGYFLKEPMTQPSAARLLVRGKATRPGPVVQPGMPAVLVSQQPAFPVSGPRSSLRRLTLAQWIASPQNPLTARVIVNRIWQFHFGEGLIRTPSDFGTNGERPTHPELLDWLADRFVQDGWSIKKLHRLILTSNAYQMSKRWNAAYGAEDPENRLLWRMHNRRLEVEAMRDSILAVTGQLDRAMYGPSIFPHVPKAALEGHSDPDKIWPRFDERQAARRTVYSHVKRSMIVPFLEVLDLCDTTRTAAKRNVTTIAPQALTLMNSEFTNRQAQHFAARLAACSDSSEAQINYAYRLLLCRPPTPSEKASLHRFLQIEADAMGKEQTEVDARHHALEQMCRVLLNLNEFVYPD